MQNLRWLIVLLCLFATTGFAAGEPLTVCTWNLKWFPSGRANLKDPAVETERIAAAANVLRSVDPDILLLEEVRDEDSAQRLLQAIAPNRYHLLIVSRFVEFGTVGWQQLVIAAKVPAKVAFALHWNTTGPVDPPRGFAFAALEWDGRLIAVYVVHLKSNLVRGDAFKQGQLNILKRELAVQQLIGHIESLSKIGVHPDAIIVGGDFNTNPMDLRFASERTLSLFAEQGFANPLMILQADRRVSLPGHGKYADTTFDFLLLKSATSHSIRVIENDVSDHRPVVAEVSVSP